MPSFKIAFASVALALATLTNVAATPADASHLSRRVVDIERREATGASVARALAAKTRAASKRAPNSSDLVERQTFTAADISAFSAYTNTPCKNNGQCLTASSKDALFSPYGQFVCNQNTHFCQLNCIQGYLGPNIVGNCRPSGAFCPTPPPNGIYVGKAPNCVLRCDSAIGYSPKFVNGVKVCVNKNVDPRNCGPGQGVVCPMGYGGTGIPTCTGGVCYVVCPRGQTGTTTASGQTYCK